jgi:hypothetical protein
MKFEINPKSEKSNIKKIGFGLIVRAVGGIIESDWDNEKKH